MKRKKMIHCALIAVSLLQVVSVATAQNPIILVTPDGHVLTGAGGSFILAAPATPVPPNAAPVASDVSVQGNLVVGQTLGVSFTYSDAENDPQGTSAYQWYRADNAAGTNSSAISGATADTYVLTTADVGKYITAGVTPKATAGTISGVEVKATALGPVTGANAAPVASMVNILGMFKVGQTVSASFRYTDAENDPQGTTKYQWYRADDVVGTNSSAISGATLDSYTLVLADQNKYIVVGITPVATSGASPGVELKTTYPAAVAPLINCPASVVVNHTAGAVSPETVSITYGVVSTTLFGSTPKCAITRNLGATTQATSATDATAASAGWYWQFNRKQGYTYNGTTRTPATTWITSIDESGDWSPAADPCTLLLGTGWRLLTNTEWTTAYGASGGNWANYTDAYNSVLKLHAAGYQSSTLGVLQNRGAEGTYWSSTQFNTTFANFLFFASYLPPSMYTSTKTFSYPVRCLRD